MGKFIKRPLRKRIMEHVDHAGTLSDSGFLKRPLDHYLMKSFFIFTDDYLTHLQGRFDDERYAHVKEQLFLHGYTEGSDIIGTVKDLYVSKNHDPDDLDADMCFTTYCTFEVEKPLDESELLYILIIEPFARMNRSART